MGPAELPSAPVKQRTQRFKFFPNLPSEIRLMVWNFCLPGPRVLDVKMRRIFFRASTGKVTNSPRFMSSLDHPVILHICSESRSVALKHYTLAFPNTMRLKTKTSPAQIYIDFSIDMVWFDNLHYFPTQWFHSARTSPNTNLAKIRFLVMRHCVDHIVMDSTRSLTPGFFPALEAIYQVDHRIKVPHSVSLDVHGQCISRPLAKLWEKDGKKCPIIYLAHANEIP
ncbi:hypothetical protein VC83_01113 [Pseudogymnoascus destructans]|uniref:2EXR domain-containing protein n=2 Tax=Pseudogymnoascus destructans TaxID=655981 RepID=L8G4M9_PSED2|nr:uncharacterized protein VC83_01113 [Pseudogymnoascus destructans]ELR07779.1 hypothetical protein GMDG_00402 [Pseudogymnoascus destructans 20631-21]OAF62338.1 hypothetical protein VC83_01113 [Pseudogymnoascus destructans]